MRRILVFVAAALILTALATGYVLKAGGSARRSTAGAALRLDRPGQVLFRHTGLAQPSDHVATLVLGLLPAATEAGRAMGGLKCIRFHTAGGTGACYESHGGLVNRIDMVITDRDLRVVARQPVAGVPSRVRVSPSGNLVAWTTFVNGDGYSSVDLSTRTSILDVRTRTLHKSLEDYALTRDGARYRAADINVWGVTFADDTRFYATAGTKGKTYLVEGDRAKRTLRTLRENVECPALSPDGTRVAYKKKLPGLGKDQPWRLYVLDLSTMRDTPLAEGRTLDDQAEWLDERTVLYTLSGDYQGDVWSVPADGSGAPRLLIPHGMYPAVVR